MKAETGAVGRALGMIGMLVLLDSESSQAYGLEAATFISSC